MFFAATVSWIFVLRGSFLHGALANLFAFAFAIHRGSCESVLVCTIRCFSIFVTLGLALISPTSSSILNFLLVASDAITVYVVRLPFFFFLLCFLVTYW